MRRFTALVPAVLAAMALSACDASVYSLPLPGGPDVGDDPITVKEEFADVLDLVPQSTVKVNDVSVGKVTAIDLEGYQALVTLEVRNDVDLPGNAVAELRQTSLLGEKFVELRAPDEGAIATKMKDGAVIPIERAGRNPEVEEVLGALSLLLNGGGVAQLKTITTELNKALEGRENRVKSLLKELDTFVGGLDDQRQDIVRALKAVDRLAKRLGKEKRTIAEAVDTMPPALKVLADQRRDLTRMLTALSKLGKTGTKVVNASHEDTVANLKRLRPILRQLNKAGSDLPNSLELLTTYPFPRNVVDAIKGDYVNLHVTADLDLAGVYGNLTDEPGDGNGGDTQVPELPEAPDLPDVPDLPEAPDLPGVPKPTALPSSPTVPSSPSAPSGGDDPLCPPVCTAGHVPRGYRTGGDWPEGINLELAELMLKGVQP